MQTPDKCKCGGTPRLVRVPIRGARIRGLHGWVVRCPSCRRETPIAVTAGLAVAVWNDPAQLRLTV